jgi:nitrate/nitrite transporter NarK
MTDKTFWQSGHRPTLIMAFLYFDIAFMVWNLLGPLAPIFSKALALTPAQKGLWWRFPHWRGRFCVWSTAFWWIASVKR